MQDEIKAVLVNLYSILNEYNDLPSGIEWLEAEEQAVQAAITALEAVVTEPTKSEIPF